MNIIEKLTEYGLDQKEAAVFTYLFKNLDCSAFRIAKETGIPKSTVYGVLEKLKSMGLVTSWKKNNISHYSPESPNRLISVLKTKEEIAKQIIPELRNLSDANQLIPSTRIYSGKNGVKIVLEDILETAKHQKIPVIHAAIHPDFSDYFPRQTNAWVKEREQAGIRIEIIRPDLPEAKKDPGYTNNPLRETRTLSTAFPFECSIFVYGKKTALFSLQNYNMHSAIIESDRFTGLIKQLLLFMWAHLPKES